MIDHKKSDNSVISAEDYEYDDADNLIEKTVDSVVTTYEYDYIDQLLSESRTGYSASYTYDANGNRASKTMGSTTETYTNDSGDKLTEIKVETTTIKSFVYDTAGRRTQMTDSGGTTNYAYDFESRLTSITRSGVTTNTFAYNGLDTRISRVDSTGTSTFKRMGADVTDPVLGDGAAVYTPGVSERRGLTTSYFMSDYLGSHTAQTSTSQLVTATRSFDAFGNLLSSTGSPASPFGFVGDWGYQSDPNHGLHLLGHRYYDPSVGRFLTRDAAYDGRNWYTYCDSNPLKWIDPNGYQHGPPIPVPGGGKGNGWKWNPNPNDSRGGTWCPQYPIPGQSQPSASWEPGKNGGPGHWDVDDGFRNRQRFDSRGRPITADQAHNPPKPGPAPGSIARWLKPGFILGLILLPANEGAPSCTGMIHKTGFCPICGGYVSPRRYNPQPRFAFKWW